MRKFFWLIFLLGGYLWVLTSGLVEFLLAKGKALYETVANWIAGADVDFHLAKKDKPRPSKHRRWE